MKMAQLQMVAIEEPEISAGPIVQNGSRERYGNHRMKVGGRPRKREEDRKGEPNRRTTGRDSNWRSLPQSY